METAASALLSVVFLCIAVLGQKKYSPVDSPVIPFFVWTVWFVSFGFLEIMAWDRPFGFTLMVSTAAFTVAILLLSMFEEDGERGP